VVVVYKIDRLSRSLMDFAKLVEASDRRTVTFVSVTQSFNTTTSMGRLTLNILLSFAQFEREVTGERIRDKVAASRKKGMWMGGWAPFGYEVKNRKLVINDQDAQTVRWIFRRFVTLGSATLLARELKQKDVRNRYGQAIDKGVLYKMLNNRTYIGDAVHKGTAYPGEHDAIIERKLWDEVHSILQESPRKRAAKHRAQTPALLKGLIFDSAGVAMSPTHTRRRGKLYRYYVTQQTIKGAAATSAAFRVPAGEIEEIVVDQVRRVLASPELIVATWKTMRTDMPGTTERWVREALVDFDQVWAELFPAEQSRILQLITAKVVVASAKVDVHLRVDGFASLIADLKRTAKIAEAA
jgi:hypothetical protein